MTPTEVWEGFNPIKEPLETSIISSDEQEHLVCSRQFFTSETCGNERVRVYSEIYYDNRWTDDRAAILVIPSLNSNTDYTQVQKQLVEEGYVVCVFDYCGSYSDNIRRTTFPAELSYASQPQCTAHINTIESDARHTPWFVWTKIARRAVSLLCEHRLVADDRIGVIGIGVGAQIAWQLAGMDGRVRALVPINGGGYLWTRNKSRFTDSNLPSSDEERAFSSGVGAETYAKFVTCPTFLIASSSSLYYDIDRAGDILSLVPSSSKQLLISHGMETQISKSAFTVLVNWLRHNFALDGAPPSNPQIGFEQNENELYLRLDSDTECTDIRVNVCYGEPLSYARCWKTLGDLQKTAATGYVVNIPVIDADELIVAYATFTYANGNMVSAPISAVIPSRIGIMRGTAKADESTHIIYDGSMGLGTFFVATDAVYLDESVLKQAVGPCDIKGITIQEGTLVLCRSQHEIAALDHFTALHFDAYTPSAREITIGTLSLNDMTLYTTTLKLDGGDYWQKVLLENTAFKSADGKTLQQFNDIKVMYFSKSENVVFNNLLWV